MRTQVPFHKGAQPPILARICCGQMARWIKISLSRKVGLDSSDIVLDGDPAPLPKRGQSFRPSCGPCLLFPNGWMAQDATWYGDRPRTKRHCARWGPSSLLPKCGQSPQFSSHVYCGQTAAWIQVPLGMEVGLGPGHIVLDGDPGPLLKRGHTPNFRPMFVVAKRLDGSRYGLLRWKTSARGNIVLDADLALPPPLKGHSSLNFGPCLLWPNGWMDQDATWCKGWPRAPGHIVLHGDQFPLPSKKGTAPNFRPMSLRPNGRPSQLLTYC